MSDNRPNILLITTDQQRFDTIAAAGNKKIFTPHLDWLRDQGIEFSRHYCDCPVCMPSRATIMTGLHAYNHGATGNVAAEPIKGHPTLPGLLSAAGYQTRGQGKMHFEPMRANYGMEHMELPMDYYREMMERGRDVLPKAHGIGENEMAPVISSVDHLDSLTYWTAKRSVDFLETRDETRPFFLWTSFTKPHPPFDPPQAYWDIYDNIEMEDPVHGDWSASVETIPDGFLNQTYHLCNAHRYSPEQLRASRRAYYACISHIDYTLGLLFSRMREMNLLRNTWILFTSDHGEMLGDHFIGGKSVFFEGSAHVPMIVRPPGEWDIDERRGTTCNEITCMADLLPTICGLTGSDMGGAQTDGRDMMALYDGQDHRETFIGECYSYHCVMEDQYKYTFTADGGAELMFDLQADPYEQHDLLAAGESSEVAERLRARLVEKLEKQGHPAVENGQLKAVRSAPGEREVHYTMWPGFHTLRVPTDILH